MLLNSKKSKSLKKQLPGPIIILLILSCLFACNPQQEKPGSDSFQIPEALDREAELKFRYYAVKGRTLYKQHCANCHQENGSGLARLIPPLAGADFLQNNQSKVVCIIRHGMEGSIVVNGQEYNQPMPPNPELKDIEIAEITSYILNAWGNKGEFVPVQQANEWLQDCEQGAQEETLP